MICTVSGLVKSTLVYCFSILACLSYAADRKGCPPVVTARLLNAFVDEFTAATRMLAADWDHPFIKR